MAVDLSALAKAIRYFNVAHTCVIKHGYVDVDITIQCEMCGWYPEFLDAAGKTTNDLTGKSINELNELVQQHVADAMAQRLKGEGGTVGS